MMRKLVCLFMALALVASIVFTLGVGQAQAADSSYTVQRGDTLTGIAARYGITVSALAQANGINNVNNIFAGQVLKIPGASGDNSNTNPAPAPTTGETAYIVQRGDTLSGVSARFNVPISTLAARNGLSTMSFLYIGQTLRIPGSNSGVGGQGGAPVNNPAPTAPPAPAVAPASSGKWIDVNISQQRLTAFEGDKAVFSSLVSTGISRYPTVTGTFNIYVKYQSQAMSGGTGRDYYYLPGVPYVMYFYQAYAIHGTYWHNNFGRPMSHGCVNLPTPAAQFMYNWAPTGTPVKVHY